MSSKLGLLFSLLFFVMFFALGVDLITIQYVYSSLDTKSVNISYEISKHGTLEESFVQHLEETYNIDFTCVGNCNPQFGDVVNYTIATEIEPLIVSSSPMTLVVSRSAVIGFYG